MVNTDLVNFVGIILVVSSFSSRSAGKRCGGHFHISFDLLVVGNWYDARNDPAINSCLTGFTVQT